MQAQHEVQRNPTKLKSENSTELKVFKRYKITKRQKSLQINVMQKGRLNEAPERTGKSLTDAKM